MLKHQISWKSVQWKTSCFMRADVRTDMTKLTVAFRSFAKSPETVLLVLKIHIPTKFNKFRWRERVWGPFSICTLQGASSQNSVLLDHLRRNLWTTLVSNGRNAQTSARGFGAFRSKAFHICVNCSPQFTQTSSGKFTYSAYVSYIQMRTKLPDDPSNSRYESWKRAGEWAFVYSIAEPTGSEQVYLWQSNLPVAQSTVRSWSCNTLTIFILGAGSSDRVA